MTLDAAQLDAYSRSWIGGRERAADGPRREHRSPATGESIGSVELAGADAVDEAVRAARAAQAGWAALSTAERARAVLDFAEAIAREADLLAELEALEVGRPKAAAAAILRGVPDMARRYAGLAEQVSGDLFRASAGRLGFARRLPRGVVAAITPWNVPGLNVLIRALPALLVGNALVVKPSEYSPRSAVALARLAAEAGLPDGVLNVVLGAGAEAGRALAEHPDVDFISFTGSTATGMAIARASAERSLKPVALECGGKSAQVLLDDIFEDEAIWPHVFVSAFWNSGQWCAAKTRLLVPRARVDAALAGLRAASAAFPVGDPFDDASALGPLANSTQAERVEQFYALARRTGRFAELDCPQGADASGGCYARPAVVTDLPGDSPLLREEVFGPLLAIQPFDDVEDAVALANRSEYGLTGAVWTNSMRDAHRVAFGLRAGAVAVFSSASATGSALAEFGSIDYYEPQGQSGFGVDGGLPGMEAYTTVRTTAFHN